MQINIHAVLQVTPADDSPQSALHSLVLERGFEGATMLENGAVEIVVDLQDVTA